MNHIQIIVGAGFIGLAVVLQIMPFCVLSLQKAGICTEVSTSQMVASYLALATALLLIADAYYALYRSTRD